MPFVQRVNGRIRNVKIKFFICISAIYTVKNRYLYALHGRGGT